MALLQLLTQDIHKGNVSSPPVVFVLMPSGSLAVFSLILNFVTGGLARLQIHEHPQSETRTMSNSHFDLPVQFTHTKDQQNLVSSASSLLFFVFISLFVSVFPGFILTVARGLYLARHISTLRYLKNMSFSWVELNSLITSNVFEGWKIYDF